MKPRLLVLDDEQRMVDIVGMVLRRSGYEVETFVDSDGNVLGSEDPSDSASAVSVWGIGDIKLRSKWHFLQAKDDGWIPDSAVFGEIKVPSGDEDNFLGTGETHFTIMGVSSKKISNFNPHINLGFEFATDADFNQFRYVVGADTAFTKHFTLAVDIIGRSLFERDIIDPDLVSLGVGGKVNPWKTLTLIGNIIVPLNPAQGLRANVTWTLGAEYTF